MNLTCQRGLDELLEAVLARVLVFLEDDYVQDDLDHRAERGVQDGTDRKAALSRYTKNNSNEACVINIIYA